MRKFLSLKALFAVMFLVSCNKTSPELIPCMCDGSESTLGLFDCMCDPMKRRPIKKISYLQDTNKPRYQTLVVDDEQQDAFLMLHKGRGFFAPIKLEHVDFRIKKGRNYENYSDKLGDYRFRIFGCRRESRNVFLNQGRALQKDMNFFDVFFETMNEFYPVVVEKTNPYYLSSDRIEYPEYIITAEITDYFMNVCDEFDWEKVKSKELRSGTSEMTVVWRIMSLDKKIVYCKGMTTGYGQIMAGEPRGETLLVERAFEDALTKVPEIECFNKTLLQRIRPEEIQSQIEYLQVMEKDKQTFASQYDGEIKAIDMMQKCYGGVETGAVVTTGGVNSNGVMTANGGANGNGVVTTIVDTVATTGAVTSVGGAKGSGAVTSVGNLGVNGVVSSVGGVDGSGMVTGVTVCEDCDKVRLKPVSIITETSDATGSGSMIEMNSGITGSGSIVKIGSSCDRAEVVSEDGGVVIENSTENTKMDDDYWVDIPLDTEDEVFVETKVKMEDSFADSKNSFCIANNPPYENMNPYNLYKVRASVVNVENAGGQKGAGLIISDNLILTSADLMIKGNNNFMVKTINGKEMKAAAFRVNPNKNVALLLLSKPTKFAPLPMALELPEVNKDILMTLGLLDLDTEGEGYLDNEGKVIGYRWSESGDAEIIVDTFVQTVTLGGALIDKNGNIVGLAHKTKRDDDGPDLFIPVDSALKSLGLEICGHETNARKPAGFKASTALARAIENSGDKRPKPMSKGARK